MKDVRMEIHQGKTQSLEQEVLSPRLYNTSGYTVFHCLLEGRYLQRISPRKIHSWLNGVLEANSQ